MSSADEKVLLSAALCDLYVSLPYSRHIWELLCTMANSTQCKGSSPVQWVSPVDQYNHSDSMISSSSPLSECGRRVGAGRRRASTGKERWKSDGVREEGRFQSQRWLREMFLPSIWNTEPGEGNVLDSEGDKRVCGRLCTVWQVQSSQSCTAGLSVFAGDRSQSGWQRQLVTP